LGKNTQHFSVR